MNLVSLSSDGSTGIIGETEVTQIYLDPIAAFLMVPAQLAHANARLKPMSNLEGALVIIIYIPLFLIAPAELAHQLPKLLIRRQRE